MVSIYDIKPKFQALLRPTVKHLAKKGISANQVTLFACGLSLLTGLLLVCLIHWRWVFWLVPIALFIRMALNAIDGMLAKEHNMKTPLGAFLNELTDMFSDAFLYLPFALLAPINPLWVVAIVILAIITEATSLAAVQIGASRRYDGPMGKSDRAFVFSIIAILLALGLSIKLWLSIVWAVLIILLILTIFNRCKKALGEINA